VGNFEKNNSSPYRCVHVLDLSSNPPCWQRGIDMLVERQYLRVGVLNDKIYAVSIVEL